VNSATQITASIAIDAAAAVGPRNVMVTTDGGQVTAGGFAVNVPAPTLTGMSPASGFQGSTLQVTLTGANLAGVTAVSFGQGITVGDITIDGPNQLTVEITIEEAASAGERTVTLTAAGGSASLSDDFTVAVPPPALEGIDVAAGRQKQTIDVVLTGADLDGATAVSFGDGITVNSIVAESPTEIRVSMTIDKDAEPGLRDVSVTTPGGTTSLPEAFEVQEAGGSISLLWWVGLALLLLLLGLLFLVLMRRRKSGKQAKA